MTHRLRALRAGGAAVVLSALCALVVGVGLAGSATVTRPTITVQNDADHDGVFNAAETIPQSATFPWTVAYRVTISTAGVAGTKTIVSITDDQTSDIGTCQALVGTTLAPNQTRTCTYSVTLASAAAAPRVNTVTFAYDGRGMDVGTGSSTVNFPPAATPTPPPTVTPTPTPTTTPTPTPTTTPTPTPTTTPTPTPTTSPTPTPTFTPSESMDATVSATARCAGRGRFRMLPTIPGGTNRPFKVTVRVAGPSQNVRRVEFRRNHRLIRTLTKANAGASGYVLRVNPRKLRLLRRYAITSRVVVRAPGTFKKSGGVQLVKNLKSIGFVRVARCQPRPIPPTPG